MNSKDLTYKHLFEITGKKLELRHKKELENENNDEYYSDPWDTVTDETEGHWEEDGYYV